MRKIILSLIAILLIASSMALSISATATDKKYVYDNEGLFTDAQYNELERMAAELASSGNAEFYLVTVNQSYYEGEWFCENHGISMQNNVVLLVVNSYEVTELCYDIYTYGDAWSKITDTEIDRIVYHKEIYDNLKANKAYEGSAAYFKYAGIAYNGHLAAPVSKIIIISLIVGAVVALIVCISIYISYKTKQKSVKYPLNRYASLELSEQRDAFVGKSVTRTRIQSSSGGGGRGGSRSGGGSGRGGGGGHRGGA